MLEPLPPGFSRGLPDTRRLIGCGSSDAGGLLRSTSPRSEPADLGFRPRQAELAEECGKHRYVRSGVRSPRRSASLCPASSNLLAKSLLPSRLRSDSSLKRCDAHQIAVRDDISALHPSCAYRC